MASFNRKALLAVLSIACSVIAMVAVKATLAALEGSVAGDTAATPPSLAMAAPARAGSDLWPSSNRHEATETQTRASSTSTPASGAMTAAEADAELVQKWKLDRGYMRLLPNDGYKAYDKDTLKILASSGDIKALQLLAEFGGVTQEAKDLYAKAAVLGSTFALGRLVTVAADNSATSDDAAAKKAYAIEAMAYARVAAMRGDKDQYFSDMTSPRLTNPSRLQLSENDYAQVKPLAEKIYKELEQQRRDIGLGSFDNFVPPEVVRHFNAFDPSSSGIPLRY